MSWNDITRTPADNLFSKYVRLRDRKCLRCGLKGGGDLGITGLQCSHFYGRRKQSVRFDLENADSLCPMCHKHFTEHKTEYEEWKLKRMGQKAYDLLLLRSNTTGKKDYKLQQMIWREMLKEDFNI